MTFHRWGPQAFGDAPVTGTISAERPSQASGRADGTPEAARRLERVLTTDPGMGVVRHADAGYPEAIEFARANGVKIPMMK